jgi:hypothetical protein
VVQAGEEGEGGKVCAGEKKGYEGACGRSWVSGSARIERIGRLAGRSDRFGESTKSEESCGD